MPSMGEALSKAAGYFRRAATRRTGEARGKTLKALAQALIWQHFLALPFDEKECLSAAREALTLLPVQKFPAEHAELNRIAMELEKVSSAASSEAVTRARRVLEKPVDKWLEQTDVISTIDIFHQSASAVGESDPKLALKLWMAVDSLMRSQLEAKRKAHDRFLVCGVLLTIWRSRICSDVLSAFWLPARCLDKRLQRGRNSRSRLSSRQYQAG
jgi:hypothetical protein